ncbi:MAG: flagellar biosynthesis/type III secretory pathway chaperone [Akkermansiaceae bacterium]|nr:flagellar biosynthesis protein FlgN [Sulfitobacter sp. CW3]NOR29531.1 flagellar biosynthesis protein FlgN [Sulfitobacter sp.]
MESLDDVLEAERSALIKGKLDLLTSMADRKEALIEALNSAEVDDDTQLKLLDVKVKRNQELLNNALEGIRKVTRRMAAFRRVQASLETYDKNGDKCIVEVAPKTSVERRA